jgi:hypothetical protein
MPTLTFPTLSRAPVFYAWTEQLHVDPTFASPAEQGCILTRLRATVSYKRWHVQYRGVSGTDKLTVETFQTSVGVGANVFYYTCPTDSTRYLVRLASSMSFRLEAVDNSTWQIDFDIYGAQSIAAGTTLYYSTLAVLIPQLGAGVSVDSRPVFAIPDAGTMKSVGILYSGISAGINDANPVVVTIENGAGTTVVTKTYNTATQPPTSGYDSLDAALDNTVAAGEVWTIDIAQTGTANLAELYVVTTFYVGA